MTFLITLNFIVSQLTYLYARSLRVLIITPAVINSHYLKVKGMPVERLAPEVSENLYNVSIGLAIIIQLVLLLVTIDRQSSLNFVLTFRYLWSSCNGRE